MSVPPAACSMMWSASGDVGVRLRVQSRRVRHRGHWVCPRFCAVRRALALAFFHFAVPVRLVAILCTSGVWGSAGLVVRGVGIVCRDICVGACRLPQGWVRPS